MSTIWVVYGVDGDITQVRAVFKDKKTADSYINENSWLPFLELKEQEYGELLG